MRADNDTHPPLPPLGAIPPDLRSLADYERRAVAHMAPPCWTYLQEGSGDDITLRENRAAFDRIGLLPRVLADLRGGSTRVTMLGQSHAAPILLAPVAYQRIAHPEGELATMRAATAMGIGMVLSTLASETLEDVAAARAAAARDLGTAPAPLWFQLYAQETREQTLALVRRAEAAGHEAIMLTVDASIKRASFALPPGVEAANLRGTARPAQTAQALGRILLGTPLADAAPRWDDIAWLRGETRLPLLLKGIMTPQDAREAVRHGVDGIVMSNHGGRVLDGMPSPLTMLPAIAEAVAGEATLLLDSGVRRGTDVVKALALGASAVLVGRPQVHGLAVAGMAGVAHALLILRTELEHAMAQLGCATPGEIGPEHLFVRA
ncbi:alpha-hydroxy acid oxidase [Sphingobium lignivorans]|uniref:4-hydroxymandelate oxidase n=1 Tax=Sphingobium lignivorans TaxID=2735886 RepID=A0ABR6NJP3_9SPHN|nr:alpha-hydroxy acid oxidase [Sphingobium lignivorans]MBB5987498.1 4-hydroxymandelate oxidase [Sphingobium lignivorans]